MTLTSDFGLRDPYVAEMKAVILSICPKAVIVDITHQIEKFNVREGAFTLVSAVPYFPVSTIHVAVVDPGVGTKRRPIMVQTRKGVLIGPDNGLLIPAAKQQGIANIYEITNEKLMRPSISRTFHGRDIFAPIAAKLASGISPMDCGIQIDDPVEPEFAKVTALEGAFAGEVFHIDDFGNIITSISMFEWDQLIKGDWVNVELPRRILKLRFLKTYGEAKTNELIVLVGSHGFIEIALNQGNASEKYKIRIGDRVKLARV